MAKAMYVHNLRFAEDRKYAKTTQYHVLFLSSPYEEIWRAEVSKGEECPSKPEESGNASRGWYQGAVA